MAKRIKCELCRSIECMEDNYIEGCLVCTPCFQDHQQLLFLKRIDKQYCRIIKMLSKLIKNEEANGTSKS